MNLQGKKALVFGGTSGIGLATIKMLQAEGASVVAISRNPDKAGDIAGVELAACDVRDEAALVNLFAAHAPFDVLISAATGGERAAGPFLQMDLAGYRASFDNRVIPMCDSVQNTSAMMATLCRICAPARRAKPGQAAIASVGGAVEQFVRAVTAELAPKRINVVSPGVIDTPMFGNDADARAKMLGGATAKNLILQAPRRSAEGIMFVVKSDFVTAPRLMSMAAGYSATPCCVTAIVLRHPVGLPSPACWGDHDVLRRHVHITEMAL